VSAPTLIIASPDLSGRGNPGSYNPTEIASSLSLLAKMEEG